MTAYHICIFFFFQAEDGIRDLLVTGVQTCALPISLPKPPAGRALSEGKEAPQAAFPSWCFPAQTKRRTEGIRVPVPLAWGGSSTARVLLLLCPESACQTGPSPELSSRLAAGGCLQACTGKDRVSFHTGGAPALRPGAIAQSPGREAALCWASLPKPCPASSVRAREGAGCGSVGAVSGA